MKAEQRRAALAASKLYLVTGGMPVAFLDTVLEAGINILQLREKTLEAAPILRMAETFRAACDRHGALFFVNDRVDLALAAGADGVHVGQNDLSPQVVRSLAGPDLLIGRSTHTAEQMRRACSEPIDYLCTGPVFETPTKPGRPATGFDLVSLAAKECELPWFAIGGIDRDTVHETAAAGASRIVVVRAVTDAADPAEAVRSLRAAL